MKIDFNFSLPEALTSKGFEGASLLARDGDDGEVCAHLTELSGGRDAQREAAAVIADPEAQGVLVRLLVVGRERELHGGNLLAAELYGLALERSDEERARAVVDENADGVALRRGEVERAERVEDGDVVVCADGNFQRRAVAARRAAAVLVNRERLVGAAASFDQIQLGAEGEERRRVHVRVDLVVGEKDARGGGRGLGLGREQQAVAVEIGRAGADLERGRADGLRRAAQEDREVELLAGLERKLPRKRPPRGSLCRGNLRGGRDGGRGVRIGGGRRGRRNEFRPGQFGANLAGLEARGHEHGHVPLVVAEVDAQVEVVDIFVARHAHPRDHGVERPDVGLNQLAVYDSHLRVVLVEVVLHVEKVGRAVDERQRARAVDDRQEVVCARNLAGAELARDGGRPDGLVVLARRVGSSPALAYHLLRAVGKPGDGVQV